MMRLGATSVVLLLAVTASEVLVAQSDSGPRFEVVSIKRNTSGELRYGPPIQRPDGGFTRANVPLMQLIGPAFPPTVPDEIVNLPDWTRTERYDVIATSSLVRATAADSVAMLRAMLADRLKLATHVDQREVDVYELVLARRDGRLGPGLQRSAVDCDTIDAERDAGVSAESAAQRRAQMLDLSAPPGCQIRTIAAVLRDTRGDHQSALGDLLEGEATLARLAEALRQVGADRPTIDKTGLTGTYRMRMNFDQMALRRGPTVDPGAPERGASILVAIQEQLGLKLQPAKMPQPRLVIDHIERPTED